MNIENGTSLVPDELMPGPVPPGQVDAESPTVAPSGKGFGGKLGSTHTRRIVFASLASWVSRAVSILSGLLLIPVLFRHFGKEELGVWLLLGQSWAVLGILDFGIGPTVARRIALAKGRSGHDVTVPLNAASRKEVADLFFSSGVIFRVLAVVTLALAWTSGYFYLRHLQLHVLPWHTALLAWSVLCAGQAANVWTLAWTNLLIGLGYVGWEVILLSSVSVLTIAVQIGICLAGGGLLALAIVQTVASILPRYLFRWFTRRTQPEMFSVRGHWDWQLVKSMIGPSLRCWLTTLGGVLIMQTDQFFVAQSKGAAELPSYRGAYLLCINIQMLAVSVAGASAPFISQLWQAEHREQARQFALRNLRFGLALVLCGIAAVVTGGQDLFTIWLGPGHFSGYRLLVVFSVIMVFETHAVILTTASRATEDEAFAFWGMAAGALKIVFSLVLMKYLGLLGIALGTLVAQALTNYWYMPFRGLSQLKIPFSEYASSVLLPMTIVSGTALLFGWGAAQTFSHSGVLLRLAGVVLSCGGVLAGSLWLLVLGPGQRHQLVTCVAFACRRLSPAERHR